MPAVPAPAKVLISGVNGYVGAWVAQKFLEHGFSVRGTVRSIEKSGKHLYDLFSKYGDKFELVEVQDITAKGAFDDAVKGVDVVAHTASPFHFNYKVPAEIIDPAVKGTTSILQSIYAHGSSVKRVILTASISSIWTYFVEKPTIFTEKDWNEQAIQVVEAQGVNAHPGMVYSASKTLAEKAAWKFKEDNNVSSWDLAVINPTYIFGPPINEVKDSQSLGTSQKMLFDILTGAYSQEQLDTTDFQFVDVRDVAEMHVRAVEIEEAGSTRALISGKTFFAQDLLDAANALSPRPYEFPNGKPGSTQDKPRERDVSIEFFKRTYGFKLHTTEDIIRDSIADFQKRGWIQ